MELRYYTGVGSRSMPADVVPVIERIAVELRNRGMILRSGRADGADAAFEYPAGSAAELYIPWMNFGADRKLNGFPRVIIPSGKLLQQAMSVAAEIHPNWDAVSGPGELLHARNVFQVFGQDLNTPSEFLICYAKPDKRSVKGGTRTAYELAKRAGIPTWNLYFPNEEEDLMDYLGLEMAA